MILTALRAIARCLLRASIPYMVTGGQAVLQYGRPRLTRDVDITVALTPQEVGRVVEALPQSVFQSLPEDVEDFVKDTWVLPVEHRETGVRVDLILSATSFERKAIENAREIVIEGEAIRYISPENLVVQKIIAGRGRDLEDARGILEVQGGEIDRTEIEGAIEALARETGETEWAERWRRIQESPAEQLE